MMRKFVQVIVHPLLQFFDCKYLLYFLIGLLCSSCSLLSPVKVESENTYLIDETPAPIVAKKHSTTLLVMPPESVPAYNTTQMAYSIKPHQIGYFIQNRWAETPAQMLYPLIVKTLQDSHHFHAIVTPPMRCYDYVLSTQILELQQDFTYCPSMIRFKLRAELTRASNGCVVGTKEFLILEPAPQNTPYGGVIAANIATEELLFRLRRFCLAKI